MASQHLCCWCWLFLCKPADFYVLPPPVVFAPFHWPFQLTDYLGCDWAGTLEVSPDLEEFKAIPMETDIDADNVNKHLSLSIHADNSGGMNLHIYTPYWLSLIHI